MNFRHIEAFASVMRAGTTSRAAEALGVTQPAISRSISEFERLVGFPLFARVRKRLVPTPEAELLYKDVEATFRGVDTIRAAAAKIRDQGSGELRIATLSALGSSLVPRAIQKFLQKHAKVRVTLHVLPSRDVRDLIASGHFDIGLAADEIDVTGITHQVFLAPAALCAIPSAHPLATKTMIVPADLDGLPFIGYVPEDRSRQRLDQIMQEAGAAPRVIVETIYASTVCALVGQGVGIGMVHPYAARGLDLSNITLRPFEPKVEVKTLLIQPAGRPKSVHVRDFVDALMACR